MIPNMGNRLFLFRSYIGLSQAQLAKRLFLSGKTISAYECGRANMSPDTIYYFYQEFGLRPDYFFMPKITSIKDYL